MFPVKERRLCSGTCLQSAPYLPFHFIPIMHHIPAGYLCSSKRGAWNDGMEPGLIEMERDFVSLIAASLSVVVFLLAVVLIDQRKGNVCCSSVPAKIPEQLNKIRRIQVEFFNLISGLPLRPCSVIFQTEGIERDFGLEGIERDFNRQGIESSSISF